MRLLSPLVSLLLLVAAGAGAGCSPSSLPPAVTAASLAATPLLAAYERAPAGVDVEARWEAVWAAYRDLRGAVMAYNAAVDAGARPDAAPVNVALCRLVAAVSVVAAAAGAEGGGQVAADVAPFLAAAAPVCGVAR